MSKQTINEAQLRDIVKKSVNEVLRKIEASSKKNEVNESLFSKIKDKINNTINPPYPEGKPKSLKEVIAADGYKVYTIVEKNNDGMVIAVVNGYQNSFTLRQPLDFDEFIEDLNIYFHDNGKPLHAEEVNNDEYDYYRAGSLIKISKTNVAKQALKEEEEETESLNPFYAETDMFGRTGKPGQVRSFELGYNDASAWEREAEEQGVSIAEYVKSTFEEVNDGTIQFLWQTLGRGYGYHGNEICTFTDELTGGKVVAKDIYGQIMFDEYCPES